MIKRVRASRHSAFCLGTAGLHGTQHQRFSWDSMAKARGPGREYRASLRFYMCAYVHGGNLCHHQLPQALSGLRRWRTKLQATSWLHRWSADTALDMIFAEGLQRRAETVGLGVLKV
eukprot:gnl/TRDRNA2_/TRDRNA2_172949_c1_seq1.p1 gnl/TRDRNA2_/TRDRNA2_172949_c1~~gnl/TRDRNA2_/TRDRNA2_172949_c1_seq1.p1  ORF type:complete len:117 (+),score=5.63 gnl/TRDRNA2_/TRDRNA2_172949_c1_seq1:325-675(+)